ncbi:MAG TPA: fumarate hydratase C-terminal domain-containing protein [Atribacteraceae bacterium]|nr:fumarate hydratase C-terminal domain-containing protein [Atribacteraceae bacterium]
MYFPEARIIQAPISQEQVLDLEAGQWVRLFGAVILARDTTHQKLVEDLAKEIDPPVPLAGSVIYYAGPTPVPPYRVVGSIGPTTAQRMDRFLPFFFGQGVRATIGKGERSREAFELHQRYRAIYFLACGGAAAYLSRFITACELLAYPELGTQALRRVHLAGLPVLVAYDARGGNIFHYAVKT